MNFWTSLNIFFASGSKSWSSSLTASDLPGARLGAKEKGVEDLVQLVLMPNKLPVDLAVCVRNYGTPPKLFGFM